MDWTGAVVLCPNLLAAEPRIGVASNANPATVAPFVIGALLLGMYLPVERRRVQPLILADYRRSRQAWPTLLTLALTIGGVISVVNYTTVSVLGETEPCGYGYSARFG